MAYIKNTLDVSTSNTWTAVGAVMTSDTRCNIYIVNRTTNSGNIRVGISAATPTDADCIFYDFPIAGKGTFIITDTLVKSGDGVWIYAPNNFTVRVEGKEESVPTTLDSLSDVVITAPVALDQVLKYDGTNWING